jgi:hypothetical protein
MIKAKLLPRYPSSVTATAPIVRTIANGNLALSYDSSSLPQVASPTVNGKVVVREGAIYNEVPALNIAYPAIADQRLLGNVSGGSAAAVALTGTQTNTVLPAFTGDSGSGGVKGLVPAPAAGDAAAGRYLDSDGTWSVPTGAVSSVAGRTGAVTLDGTDVAFTQAGAGASTTNVTLKARQVVSIKDFGAVGDNNGTTGNGTNDRAAIQAAITYALTVGAEVYVPAGRYRVSTGLTADMSAVSATVQFHFSMRGDGAGQSMFIFDTGAINGLTVTGPSATVPAESYFRMDGISFIKNDAQGSGLVLNRSAYASVDNANFIAWQNNIYALDFLSCSFRRVNCRFGTYGIVAEYLAFSRPSALSFFDCEVSNNSENGYKITNGSNINIFGGGVQGNGIAGVTGTRGGVLMVGGPLEGSSGLAMFGTYLEGNNGEADIYISNSDYPGTYNFYGLTIQRNNVLPAVNFCTNNILVDGSSVMRINVNGCSFRKRNDYVQDAGRPYINIVTPATTRLVLGLDNYFTPGVDYILPAGDHFLPSSVPRAYWYGDTTGPTATYQKGTASVTKNGTGDITITYSATLLSATNFPQLSIVGGAGYISVTSQSTTTIRIVRNNAAGTPTDGLVSVAIYGL